jgi:hypothetical protein
MEESVRIRTIFAGLAVAALLTVASSASAQEKGATNFGITYTNLTTFANSTHVNNPIGWLASVGSGINKTTSIVGEVGGNYKKIGGVYAKFHTYQVGVRFLSTKSEKATPFFQVVTGGGHSTGSNSWVFTPGGGVDSKLSDKVSVRIQGDWMLIRNSGTNVNGLRFGAGIVFNMAKK